LNWPNPETNSKPCPIFGRRSGLSLTRSLFIKVWASRLPGSISSPRPPMNLKPQFAWTQTTPQLNNSFKLPGVQERAPFIDQRDETEVAADINREAQAQQAQTIPRRKERGTSGETRWLDFIAQVVDLPAACAA